VDGIIYVLENVVRSHLSHYNISVSELENILREFKSNHKHVQLDDNKTKIEVNSVSEPKPEVEKKVKPPSNKWLENLKTLNSKNIHIP